MKFDDVLSIFNQSDEDQHYQFSPFKVQSQGSIKVRTEYKKSMFSRQSQFQIKYENNLVPANPLAQGKFV